MIIYFEDYIRKKRHSSAMVLLFSLAICAAVAWLVFLATKPNLAPNLKNQNLDWYCLGATLFFTAAAIFVAFRKRFKITIAQQEDNGQLYIEVNDPELSTPLIISEPVTVIKQWALVDLGRKNKLKVLHVTLYDLNGNSLLTFTGALGNFYDAPDGFQHVAPNQLFSADLVYDSGKIQDIVHALWSHEDYLALKNKSKKI